MSVQMSYTRLQIFEQVPPNELVQYLYTGTAKTASPPTTPPPAPQMPAQEAGAKAEVS